MKQNLKNMSLIAVSLLMLNACGEKDETDETVAKIDTSSVQTIAPINTDTNGKTVTCKLGEELILGGTENALDASKWTMTLDTGKKKDLLTRECLINGKDDAKQCIQVDPEAAGTGMYQKITTENTVRYRVTAKLIGADNYQDKNNFNQGSSYISIEDHKPTKVSKPIAHSEKVKGNVIKEIQFDFDSINTEHYLSLRGDTAFRYPTAFSISVKKIIPEYDTPEDTKVKCNL